MSEQAFHDFVGAGIVPQIDCCSGVPKLVNGDPQAGRVFHALRDLSAEHARRFWLPARAGKQARRVRSAQQVRAEVVDIFVNQFGDRFVERKLKSDTVFHIVVREDEPKGRVRPARLDQVLVDLDGDEIAEPDGCKGQDRDRNRDLGRQRCLDRSVGKVCARFTHHLHR